MTRIITRSSRRSSDVCGSLPRARARNLQYGNQLPDAAYRVKIAAERWEFDAIHRLNYQTFVEEIPQHPPHPSGRLVDRFHGENTYLICVSRKTLLGMVAVRGTRPFSLDLKIPDLDAYLPPGRRPCELRLLAVDKQHRAGRLLHRLLGAVWRYCTEQGYEVALISGTTRQLALYRHLGFVPFAAPVGSAEALFQPMMASLEGTPGVRKLFRGAHVSRRSDVQSTRRKSCPARSAT